jgi:ABC-2 type transport system ATP-binding protein
MTDQAALSAHAPSSPEWVIDISDVAKTYRGKIEALKGISMRVHRGEVFGLLGPNGAGKSTLVKILMTVIGATRCQGTILGEAVGSKEILRKVGYLPEHHRFPPYLTGSQVLDFYAAMTEVGRDERKRRIPELLELVGMQDWGKTRVGRYSKGMRQRVGIAQSLMNDPDIVLLDEPTDGVDPVGRRDIRAIVQSLKDRGKTVFLNSHLLSELEMVCDRVAILVGGSVAQQGTIDELTAGKERYEVEVVRGGESAVAALAGALDGFEPESDPGEEESANRAGKLATGEWLEARNTVVRVGTTDAERMQPIIDALRSRGAVIRAVRALRPSLEDLFMEAVGEPRNDETGNGGAA